MDDKKEYVDLAPLLFPIRIKHINSKNAIIGSIERYSKNNTIEKTISLVENLICLSENTILGDYNYISPQKAQWLREWIKVQSSKNIKGFELSERAQRYFKRAIDVGFMENTDNGYKWVWGAERGRKAKLAYFLHKVYNPNGVDAVPYKALEDLFNITRLDTAIDQVIKAKTRQRWKDEIDNKVFGD